MNAYEKLIMTMRSEGNRSSNPYPIKLGTMTSNDACVVGSMDLDSDDLMVAEHLDGKLEEGDEVLVTQISSNLFAIIEKVVMM